jgi:hypothetical protein
MLTEDYAHYASPSPPLLATVDDGEAVMAAITQHPKHPMHLHVLLWV